MDTLSTKAMMNFALFSIPKGLPAPILIRNNSLTFEESKAKKTCL